jgi:hypothetical protein
VEDNRNLTSHNARKILRLAQCQVEYLLHVQETLVTHKERLRAVAEDAQREALEVREKRREDKAKAKAIRLELRQARKALRTYELLEKIRAGTPVDEILAGEILETAANANDDDDENADPTRGDRLRVGKELFAAAVASGQVSEGNKATGESTTTTTAMMSPDVAAAKAAARAMDQMKAERTAAKRAAEQQKEHDAAMQRLRDEKDAAVKALKDSEAAHAEKLAAREKTFKGKIAELEAKLRDAQRAAEDATRKSHDASLSVSKDIERIENEKKRQEELARDLERVATERADAAREAAEARADAEKKLAIMTAHAEAAEKRLQDLESADVTVMAELKERLEARDEEVASLRKSTQQLEAQVVGLSSSAAIAADPAGAEAELDRLRALNAQLSGSVADERAKAMAAKEAELAAREAAAREAELNKERVRAAAAELEAKQAKQQLVEQYAKALRKTSPERKATSEVVGAEIRAKAREQQSRRDGDGGSPRISEKDLDHDDLEEGPSVEEGGEGAGAGAGASAAAAAAVTAAAIAAVVAKNETGGGGGGGGTTTSPGGSGGGREQDFREAPSTVVTASTEPESRAREGRDVSATSPAVPAVRPSQSQQKGDANNTRTPTKGASKFASASPKTTTQPPPQQQQQQQQQGTTASTGSDGGGAYDSDNSVVVHDTPKAPPLPVIPSLKKIDHVRDEPPPMSPRSISNVIATQAKAIDEIVATEGDVAELKKRAEDAERAANAPGLAGADKAAAELRAEEARDALEALELDRAAKAREAALAVSRAAASAPEIPEKERKAWLRKHPYQPIARAPFALSKYEHHDEELFDAAEEAVVSYLDEQVMEQLCAFGVDDDASGLTDVKYVQMMAKVRKHRDEELAALDERERAKYELERAAILAHIAASARVALAAGIEPQTLISSPSLKRGASLSTSDAGGGGSGSGSGSGADVVGTEENRTAAGGLEISDVVMRELAVADAGGAFAANAVAHRETR